MLREDDGELEGQQEQVLAKEYNSKGYSKSFPTVEFRASHSRCCPDAKAFKKLYEVFHCPECQGLIKAKYTGINPEAISCNCGTVHYSLLEKKREN